MTSSAKYADIVLPDLMTVEQEDIIPNDYAGNMGYLIFLQPVTAPKFERKPIYWIMSEVAKRLGPDIHQKFTEGRTQEQWLRYLYAKMVAKDPLLPSYDALKKMGIYKRKDPNGHFVAYKKFRDDADANPLKTPSGKIEIYSSKLADIAATWELQKTKPSPRCRSIPQPLKAGTRPSAANSRCNCSVSTLKPVPTPVTAT